MVALLALLYVVVVASTLLTTLNAEGISESSTRLFKVITINAYNYVDGPNWDERVLGIREMVLNSDPDCIAFEEIRTKAKNDSMLIDLKGLLKNEYPSWNYGTATMFNAVEEEGVAIACKWASYSASSMNMGSLRECTDPLSRAVAHMSVAVGKKSLDGVNITSTDLVDVYVTHWSFEECNHDMNAMETLKFVNKTSVGNSAFILGDFNPYGETTPSLELMEEAPICLGKNFSVKYYPRDSWRALYPDVKAYPGYTFSSLESKGGLHNRCDRIFYVGKTVPLNAEVICKSLESTTYPSDHCAYMLTAAIPSTEQEFVRLSKKIKRGSTQTLHVFAFFAEVFVGVLFLVVLRKKLEQNSNN